MTSQKHNVFVTEVFGRRNPLFLAGMEVVRKYPPSSFNIVSTIAAADIILYLENGYLGLAELPALMRCVRTAPSAMHFIFSESDWPFPVLPSFCPSISKSYPWAHGWAYLLRPAVDRNDGGTFEQQPHFLFSFLGRTNTHQVRRHLLSLDTAATPCIDINDAPSRLSPFDYRRTYADIIGRSKFILCPRGIGASSIRIFEAMYYGRVPVIISDQWQPPPGIPWEKVSVTVRERDVLLVPSILDRLEDVAPAMGQAAQQVFDRFFSANVFFDQLLTGMVARYSTYSTSVGGIGFRASRAFGWREIRSLIHQARSQVFEFVSGRSSTE